jgi:hypothetical protein
VSRKRILETGISLEDCLTVFLRAKIVTKPSACFTSSLHDYYLINHSDMVELGVLTAYLVMLWPENLQVSGIAEASGS